MAASMTEFNQKVIDEFRSNGGKVGGAFTGASTNPAWYHNLLVHPEVTVEIGTDKFKAKAVEAKGAERDRLFEAQARLMPQFNEYKTKTKRKIPVLALERVKAPLSSPD
jgi:deazaflavin-dependent oxidoreductase (nitroreductase family)